MQPQYHQQYHNTEPEEGPLEENEFQGGEQSIQREPRLADARFLRRLLFVTIALTVFGLGGQIVASAGTEGRAERLEKELNAYLQKDDDGDGLLNEQELEYGTNADNSDTDHDGMSDASEIAHGLNPLNIADAKLDPDEDGLSNELEIRLGTDPLSFTRRQKK